MLFQCHPPNGSVTVGWHRGDAALSPGGRLWLSADNRTLTVTAAQRGDAGPYGCHVANPISTNRSRDVNLTVACEWEGGEMGVGLRCGLLSCCVVLLCCCWVGSRCPINNLQRIISEPFKMISCTIKSADMKNIQS